MRLSNKVADDHLKALKQVLSESVATRSDAETVQRNLSGEITAVRNDLSGEIEALGHRTDQQIEALGHRMEQQMKDLKIEFNNSLFKVSRVCSVSRGSAD